MCCWITKSIGPTGIRTQVARVLCIDIRISSDNQLHYGTNDVVENKFI